MYTLRRITENGKTDNICLGKKYSVIKEADSKDNFDALQKVTGGLAYTDKTFAYVLDENESPIPLYNSARHSIITESGKTLESI
jgi:hypothetical protein